MLELSDVLDQLEALHGAPQRRLPRKALEWVLWENAGYLVSDERRAAAYRALRKATGLTADGLLGCRREALREIAEQGGPHAELRVGKWRAIGELVEQHFDGDLQAALSLPLPKARAALKRFPGIGAPGADKVLLFTGAHAVPALESNGLRVLVRLGFAEDLGDYAKTYRTGVAALEAWTGQAPWLRRAYDLLRAHGQTLCKHRAPHCDTCPLEETCPSAE
ncbi:MAG: hypothetical protein O2816_10365 [Planctomycetota bacterium]|nr:hypothetical protein [Planctomycetota bacterium]